MIEESLEKKDRREYNTGGEDSQGSMHLGCLDKKRRWKND